MTDNTGSSYRPAPIIGCHGCVTPQPQGVGHIAPPIPFNNFVGPQTNQLNYGSPGTPYINYQSVGPNGRPALTYLSPNFGFFFRNKNAAAGQAQSEGEIEAVPVDAVVDETPIDNSEAADIKFGSRR